MEDIVVFLTFKKVLLLFLNKKCARYFSREPANENKQFKETKTLIARKEFISVSSQTRNAQVTFAEKLLYLI